MKPFARIALGLLLPGLLAPLGYSTPGDKAPPSLLLGEVREATHRLHGADRLVELKQWPEALDEYQRLYDDFADDLAADAAPSEVVFSTQRVVQVRRLVQLRLARLPAQALDRYRQRVDGRVKRSLEQGLKENDPLALRKLVEEAFASQHAEAALDRLGDLAFERGDFAAAEQWWRWLIPSASRVLNECDDPRFPAPRGDVAQVRAKQILALSFQDERRLAQEELAAFEKLDSGAKGKLAGREGRYGDILRDLIAAAPGRYNADAQAWLTFGGSPSRNRVRDSLLVSLLEQPPAWRVPFRSTSQPPTPLKPRPPFHPVIADGLILLTDGSRVVAWEAATGKLRWSYEEKEPEKPRRSLLQAQGNAGHSLTVADGRVYATLVSPSDGRPVLVSLDLADPKGKPRWRVSAPAKAHFEGAPLVIDGRVVVAWTAELENRVRLGLAGYDEQSGQLRWRQELADTPLHADFPWRPGRGLVTRAGTAVVHAGSAGVIAAVDANTGQRLWALRYPRRQVLAEDRARLERDVLPAVVVQGLVYAAPEDSDRVFCLDAGTGRVHWEREGVATIQLLGVSDGRVILVTPNGLRALNAQTGNDQGGWMRPAQGRLASQGRGLLAGPWVLWPTRDTQLPARLVAIDPGGPQPPEPTRLRQLRPGNLALGQGILISADADELAVWKQQR